MANEMLPTTDQSTRDNTNFNNTAVTSNVMSGVLKTATNKSLLPVSPTENPVSQGSQVRIKSLLDRTN